MAKKIIKEISIMILLLVAIVLIFSVLFYDYIPTNKTIPNKVTYQIPEEIVNEIKETKVEETTPINVTYQVDESELTMYQKSSSYKPGNSNPFATVSGEGSTTANSSQTNNIGTSNTSTNNNTGSYLNNTSLK